MGHAAFPPHKHAAPHPESPAKGGQMSITVPAPATQETDRARPVNPKQQEPLLAQALCCCYWL
ncbi:hypothetical protein J1614_002668 [Plenodomus biglobosus]|nr:hypothetical protein J1614_002668 [Plenodomus biglobosus]